MGVLKFGPTRGKMRSVYNKDMIREIFEENPHVEGFRLMMKLSRGKSEKRLFSAGFKNFVGEECLLIILNFAEMMWANQDIISKNGK